MPESASNVGESIEQVANLLRGEPAGTPEPETPSSVAAAPTTDVPSALAPPADPEAGADELTPKAIAERLGITPDKLFTGMKIPVDGGEPLTLEEFKASGKGLRELTAAQHEFAEKKVAFENSVMTQKQTLEAAIAKIPAEALTGEMIAEVRAEHQDTIKRERAALITIRPDLKDPAKWNATRDLLVTHLQPYGFKEIEVDSIVDHRLAKYVIDNAEREKRLRELDADSLEVSKPQNLARPSAQPQPASKRAKETETKVKRRTKRGDQVAQVAKLIGERPK